MAINNILVSFISIVDTETKDTPEYEQYLRENKIWLFIIFNRTLCFFIHGL